MNYPIVTAFGLICLAFIAHMTGGLKDSLSVRPLVNTKATPADESSAKLERNWVQLMCAFQLVSVDLLAVATVLYLLAFTQQLAPASGIALGMATLFALWGIAWLLQIGFLRRPSRDYLFLGHWMFWFLCSGLMIWGATLV